MIQKHFDELRDRRVTSRKGIVVGKLYAVCHCPLDNPYTAGVAPFASIKKVVDVQFLSHNDIYNIPNRERLHQKNPEALARLFADDVLNEKVWMFRTEELPFPDGRTYVNWNHVSTYAQPQGAPFNYLLDVSALEAEGIEILLTTSVKYVESDELREEREWERKLEREWEDAWIPEELA